MNPLFKLLLIEDDVTLFNEIKDRLTGWSYEVYGITDFSKVMQEFTAIKPDLVIIDIQLPKYDGFHWCRLIPSHSNIPILFLSSRDHPTDMNQTELLKQEASQNLLLLELFRRSIRMAFIWNKGLDTDDSGHGHLYRIVFYFRNPIRSLLQNGDKRSALMGVRHSRILSMIELHAKRHWSFFYFSH